LLLFLLLLVIVVVVMAAAVADLEVRYFDKERLPVFSNY
jgi:Na+-transporting methylmalonyl-CoA/oxaloacetate decarboxylase gamma subunit